MFFEVALEVIVEVIFEAPDVVCPMLFQCDLATQPTRGTLFGALHGALQNSLKKSLRPRNIIEKQRARMICVSPEDDMSRRFSHAGSADRVVALPFSSVLKYPHRRTIVL